MNAGVALTQKYMTEDSLELHMASNHFGHFLLTNLLMPLMIQTADPKLQQQQQQQPKKKVEPGRIVALSSLGHWWGKVDLDNLNSERYYDVRNTTINTILLYLMLLNYATSQARSSVAVTCMYVCMIQVALAVISMVQTADWAKERGP